MLTINARKYVFTDFVQVLEHIEVLEQSQFVETTGNWSFYQILKHCTDHIQYSMIGYPYIYNSILRKTAGKYLLSKLLERGFMLPDGYNGEAETNRIEGDDKKALLDLKSSIYSFRRFNREFAIHPLYDTMDKPTWEKFHSIHIANHLSFVEIFPMQIELREDIEEFLTQSIQRANTSTYKTISTLSKLEALDEMMIKKKTKNQKNSITKKRKR